MSLRREATKGVKWTGAASFIASGLQLIRLVILARLLSPEDFGLMAMITVAMGFAGTFADTGFSNALIFRQDVTREQLSSLYWTTWFTGLLIFAVLIAVSPLVVTFYHEPRIQAFLPWAAASFLIAPVGQQFKVLLQRDLRFQTIAGIETAASVSSALASIALAAFDFGIFALIFGQLLGGVVDSGLAAVAGWKDWAPRLRFRLGDIKAFAGFGAFQVGERCANVFASNIDYLLIGRWLGPGALGPYTVAYQLVVAPLSRINPVLTRVAFPIFAQRQDDIAALRAGYIEISKFLAFVVSPLLVGIAAAAPVLVPLLLGNNWPDAVRLVEILAPVGLFKTLANPSGSIWLAKGRADLGFWMNVYVAIEYLIGFSISIRFGVIGVATAYLIMIAINFAIDQIIINRMLQLNWSTYLSSVLASVASALFMGLVVRLSWYAIAPSVGNGWLSAAAIVTIGVVAYGVCVLLWNRSYAAGIVGLFLANR